MTTTFTPISVVISSKTLDKQLAASTVSVGHALNGIPAATISFVARTPEEIKFFKEFDKNLFDEVTVKVNDKFLFKGFMTGVSPNESANSVSTEVTLYGGLYRLTQTSVGLPGIHPMSQSNLVTAIISGLSTVGQLPNVMGKSIIESLFSVIQTIHTQVTQALTSSVGNSLNQAQQTTDPNKPNPLIVLVPETQLLLTKISQKHSPIITKMLSEEYKKIKVPNGLTIVTPELTSSLTQSIIQEFLSNPSITFWELLVKFLEMYQIAIGTHEDKIYAVSQEYVVDPVLIIKPEDVASVSIAPFPFDVPTRCYLGSDGNLGFSHRTAIETDLEKKLGTIRALFYDRPAWMLHTSQVIGSSTNKASIKQKSLTTGDVLDKFAQIYLAKEQLKNRTATLSMKYFPTIPVGITVSFVDPFFNKTYTGYVLSVAHTLNPVSGVGTSIRLGYVINDVEKVTLGLKNTRNPLYPSFNQSEILSL